MWISDTVARSIVSFQIDKSHLDADEAEKMYLDLRREDSILFSFHLHGGLLCLPGDAPEITLYAGKNVIASGGETEPPPFEGSSTGGIAIPTYQFLARFPRNDPDGKPLVSDLSKEYRVEVRCSGRAFSTRFKPNRFALQANEL